MYWHPRVPIQSDKNHKFIAFYLKSSKLVYIFLSRGVNACYFLVLILLCQIWVCVSEIILLCFYSICHTSLKIGHLENYCSFVFVSLHFTKVFLCTGSLPVFFPCGTKIIFFFVPNEWLKHLPTQYLVTVFPLSAYFCAWTFSIFGCKEKGKYKAHEGWFSALSVFPASYVSQDPCLK